MNARFRPIFLLGWPLVVAATLAVSTSPVEPNACWSDTSPLPGDAFGCSVASGDLNGDGFRDLVVGAPCDYTGAGGPQYSPGRVYIYYGSAGGLPADPSFQTDGSGFPLQSQGHFGYAVAVGPLDGDDCDDLVIGAPQYNTALGFGLTYAGHLFVASGGPGGIVAGTFTEIEGNREMGQLGMSVAIFGHKIIAGEPGANRVRIYEGGSLASLPEIDGPAGSAMFGSPVACGGDLNGDGRYDIAVGDPLGGTPGTYRGRVHVYSGLNASLLWSVEGPSDSAYLGSSLSISADLTGDGIHDLLVGAPFANRYSGGAYIYAGGMGAPAAPAWQVSGYSDGDGVGVSVSTGDLNGDGRVDVIVGACGSAQVPSSAGLVRIYLGRPQGPDTTPTTYLFGPAGFSGMLDAASDFNGDGLADIVIGSAHAGGSIPAQGQVSLYRGFNPPPTLQSVEQLNVDLSMLPPAGTLAARSLVLRGTVADDADASLEVEVRAVGVDDNQPPLIVTTGTPAPSGQKSVATLELPPVAAAGYHWRARSKDARGAVSAWTVFGGSSAFEVDFQTRADALSTVSGLRQERPSDGTSIPLGSLHLAPAQVTFSASAADPDPGEIVRMEFEVRPVGETFLGQPTASSQGPAGTSLSATVPLVPGAYHWQARPVGVTFGSVGAWSSFGGNAEEAADFVIGLSGSVGPSSCLGSSSALGGILVLALLFLVRR